MNENACQTTNCLLQGTNGESTIKHARTIYSRSTHTHSCIRLSRHNTQPYIAKTQISLALIKSHETISRTAMRYAGRMLCRPVVQYGQATQRIREIIIFEWRS